jgi:hypothetical protein
MRPDVIANGPNALRMANGWTNSPGSIQSAMYEPGPKKGKLMQIQVNTDHNIEGREALVARVKVAVASSLDRFSTHITRIEIHLSDENGDKSGQHDKRCMMEARFEGRQPIAVTSHAATLDQAVAGATNKLKRFLDDTLEQLRGHQS